LIIAKRPRRYEAAWATPQPEAKNEIFNAARIEKQAEPEILPARNPSK